MTTKSYDVAQPRAPSEAERMSTDTMILALEQLREHVRKIVLSGDLKDLLDRAYSDEGDSLRARGVLDWATSTLSVAELAHALGMEESS
mgnify:CR=1 FL=1